MSRNKLLAILNVVKQCQQLKTIADFYHLSLDELVGRDFSENYSDEFERRIMSYIKQMDDEGKKLSLGLLSQVVNHRGNNENI